MTPRHEGFLVSLCLRGIFFISQPSFPYLIYGPKCNYTFFVTELPIKNSISNPSGKQQAFLIPKKVKQKEKEMSHS